MDIHKGNDVSPASAGRATKTLGFIVAAITLVGVLTWAVSVLFELAIAKSLAAVILALFLIVIGLMLAGFT